MSEILLLVHQINATVCSIVAIFGCCFLIFLIKTRTVVEMKSYSKILLQGCMVDLLFALSSLISAPIILLNKSTAYLVLNSIFSTNIDGQGLRYAITLIWVFTFSLIVPSCPIQFVYRYLVFCKKSDITTLHYVGYLAIPLGLTTIYTIVVFFGCFPSADDVPIANANIGYLFIDTNSTEDVRLGLRADANKIILKLILLMNFTINITSYSTITFCTYQMWLFFKNSSTHLRKKTKEAQAQITRALFCQMISPIVLVMLPLVYVVGSMAFGISDAKLSIALNMGFAWMPMVNCFTTTFFVRPYRIAVAQLLCKTRSVRVQSKATIVASVIIVQNPK